MKHIEWVDAYIAGEIPEAQLKEFEAELAQSAALREEVALARKVLSALAAGLPDTETETLVNRTAERHHRDRERLFQQYRSGALTASEKARFEQQALEDELFAFEWDTFCQAHPVAQVRSIGINWARWAAAASVVLLLGVFGWWMFQRAGQQSRELYAKYDVPELFPKSDYALVDEGLLHKGVIGSDDFEQLKLDGLRAFDAKDWPAAIQLLSEYQQKTKPSQEDTPDEINLLHLYIGRAWYEQRKPDKAVIALQTGIDGVVDLINYGRLQELMRWHLALAHLQNRDIRAAKVQLEILKNARQEDISQQAKKVMNELK